jgi:hypothetical protein
MNTNQQSAAEKRGGCGEASLVEGEVLLTFRKEKKGEADKLKRVGSQWQEKGSV